MATTWKSEPQLLESLDAAVPDILASQLVVALPFSSDGSRYELSLQVL